MANLKQYQPLPKDVGNILTGVAQVRVGRPSVRPAGTAAIKAVQYVGTSEKLTDSSTGTAVDYVKPLDMSTGGTLPAGCTLASAGTYTGAYDGCFILRATSATLIDIYSPAGHVETGVTITSFASTPKDMEITDSVASGVTIVGIPATTITAGQTWVIPVWSGLAQDKPQTGILSPYSMFAGSTESVGGLKAASFNPKLDSMETLEAGFPAETFDRIITKTTVDISMEAMEFTNANLAYLQEMISKAINEAKLPAVPVEVVCLTRSGKVYSFWMSNCGITQFPSVAPTNGFSSQQWALAASKQTEITSETDQYNTWLKNGSIYVQLEYAH